MIKDSKISKINFRSELKTYLLILFYSFLFSFGIGVFISPLNIVPGGVFGLSIVLHELISFITIGTIALCINIPLLIWGTKTFGKSTGIKTVLFMFLSSFTLDGIIYITDNKPIIDDLLVSSIFGGFMIGFTVFFVKKTGATTGGYDIFCRMMAKKLNMPFNQFFLFTDSAIIIAGVLVFGDIKMGAYCLIASFTISATIKYFMRLTDQNKTILIFSEHNELIKERINTQLNSSVVKLVYKASDQKLIVITKNIKQLNLLENVIYDTDSSATVVTLKSNIGIV